MHFINSAVFDSHDYRPMLNSVGTSTPAHPPRRHDAPTLVTRHHSFEHESEGTDTLRLSAATGGPGGLTSYYHISNFYGYASPHGGATVRVSH